MLEVFDSFRFMLMSEQDGKEYCHHKGICCKRKPYTLPVKCAAIKYKELIDDYSADAASKECAEAVCHHHEQTLGTGPDLRCTLRLHEERT